MTKVYPVLIVISQKFIQRSESNRPLTVLVFFVEMDEGWPGLGSSVTELLLCSNLLYHLYKAVFFTALFPKVVFNISNFSWLDVLFATQNLIADCCSGAAILLIQIICVTRFCSTSNDFKIGNVTSLTSTSNQDCCLDITQYRKRLSQRYYLNTETDENLK